MDFSPYEQMQRAVDIVHSSKHPDNKIAATLFGLDSGGLPYSISRTNYWPPAIEANFGQHSRFGNASGTVHAETACLIGAPLTAGASLCVTDPFCPNCAKNIAEAGVKAVYIDHKGFEKDFATRRLDHFRALSLKICERAGIAVYELRRRAQTIIPIALPPEGIASPSESPVEVSHLGEADHETFLDLVTAQRHRHRGRKIAVAVAVDDKKVAFGLTVRTHPPTGFGPRDNLPDGGDGKYSLTVEPLNRLLMAAPRHGLRLAPDLLFASQVPTAREQINLAGAGCHILYVENLAQARDDSALEAMARLQAGGVIDFMPLP